MADGSGHRVIVPETNKALCRQQKLSDVLVEKLRTTRLTQEANLAGLCT